jgi:hypothetical protein
MARARNIKPGFFVNEDLVELPFATRLLFIGLWTIADREGRLEDKPKRIKMTVFPADDVDVDAALNDLQSAGFLTRYAVEDARYIQVLAFAKHQHPHKDEKVSTIPAPGLHGAPTVPTTTFPETHPADCLNPDSLIASNPSKPLPASSERFAEFWQAWPPTERRQDKKKCLERWRARNLDQLADSILADVALKKKTQKWRDGFEEAPLVYLNNNRWEDGVVPDGPKGASGEMRHWHESATGITEKGAENGVTQDRDEPFPNFKARVFAAVGHIPSRAH